MQWKKLLNLGQGKPLEESQHILGGKLVLQELPGLPQALQQDKLLWGECLSGALYWNDFLNLAKAAGFGDPGRFLVQAERVETHRAFHRLTVSEAAIHCHQCIAVTAGNLDEIAKHAIMLDLQRADPGFLAIARFHGSDSAAGIARHFAQFIEARIVALRDEATIGSLGRRRGDERAGKQIGERAVARELRQQLVEQCGPIGFVRKPIMQPRCFLQSVADLTKVARTASASDHPPKRAADIGKGAQHIAQIGSLDRARLPELDQSEPVFDWLRREGNIAEDEMHRTFNMGIGLVFAVEAARADTIMQALQDLGETPVVIGELTNA